MALTNVWCRDSRGEWVRTTAEETDRVHGDKVSANAHMFRCYSCFQYVTFVKGSNNRVSHFRHSSSETNKDCEDRSPIYNSAGTSAAWQKDVPDPMRIRLDGNRVILEVGFLPVGTDELQKAIDAHAEVSIRGKSGKPDFYRIDHSRFIPHVMSWLPVPLPWSWEFSVLIKPADSTPKLWSIHRTPLSQDGDLFDCQTGRRIPEKSDIMVGKSYYFLCRNWKYLPRCGTVQVIPVKICNDGWKLYQVCAHTYSEEAADFFFDLHLRLTTEPADICVLWPPVVEDEDMIATNQKELIFLVCGESDFEVYPAHANFITHRKVLDRNEQLICIRNTGALQVVSAARYSRKLRSMYVKPLEISAAGSEPEILILDDERKPVARNELNAPPKNGILSFTTEVDACVDVSDENGFCYRKHLKPGTETRIFDLRYGMTLSIRLGMDLIRKISIRRNESGKNSIGDSIPWTGRPVPFPRRYAAVLSRFNHSDTLYAKVFHALQTGTIPEAALKSLIRLLEDNRHVG